MVTKVSGSEGVDQVKAGTLTIDDAKAGQAVGFQKMQLIAEKSASGINVDFSQATSDGIPSWAKRITINFSAVSTTGGNIILVQVGSGTTYSGTIWSSASTYRTDGFPVFSPVSAANNCVGAVTLTRHTGGIWVESGNLAYGNTPSVGWSSGGFIQVAPTGNLDLLRITTVSGTDTFDGGSISVIYEGYE